MGTRISLVAGIVMLAACAPGPGPSARSGGGDGDHHPVRSLSQVLSAREAEVRSFCAAPGGTRPGSEFQCKPKSDMSWRLRNYVSSLTAYVDAARRSLAGNDVAADRRELVAARVAHAEQALSAYARALDEAARRSEVQAGLVDTLNRDFDCRIRRYDQGQQVNFARELSLPECNPLIVSNFRRAADLLNELAGASLGPDADVMLEKAKYYQAVGALVADLDHLRHQLLDLNIIRFDAEGPRVDLIGHPFQSENNTNWLEAYINATRKLNRELERLGEPAAVGQCPRPACDPAIYRVAEAVTLKPPLDWTFLRDADQITAPTPYGLSFFSQRYDANGPVRWSLDLGSNREWKWRSEDYVNTLNAEERTLTFTHIFHEEKITLSVGEWDQRSEFPYVVPIFYLFQEARRVIDLLKSTPNHPVASKIRDIRFTPSGAGPGSVSIDRVPEGLRLNLAVLRPTGRRPIADVRKRLIEQISLTLSETAPPEATGNVAR